jgi:two-component system, cell cycle response regulator DivK
VSRKTILLVEDIEQNRELIIQILEDDYELVVAADGAEALRLATERRPDLILMDLSLPVMDGWEATRRIKADPSLAGTPIVAVSAHAKRGDREKAIAAGCDDHVSKPIDFDELLRVVAHYLAPKAP